MLEQAGADLLEISGGNYESPAMIGMDGDGRELRSDTSMAMKAVGSYSTKSTSNR